MSLRVDDYFRFGCGDIVREAGGRHLYRVHAVVSNRIVARSLDQGWRAEFESYEVELVERHAELGDMPSGRMS